MFTPRLEAVDNLPQPAVTVVVVGDILVGGKVVDTFRQTRRHLLVNPTQEQIMKMGAQIQAEIWPLLWQRLVVEKE